MMPEDYVPNRFSNDLIRHAIEYNKTFLDSKRILYPITFETSANNTEKINLLTHVPTSNSISFLHPSGKDIAIIRLANKMKTYFKSESPLRVGMQRA